MGDWITVSDFRADGPNRGQLFVPAETPPERRRRLDRGADRARRLYRGRVRDGLCVKCGGRNPGPGVRCPRCDRKFRALRAKKHAERKAEGRCGECGRPNPRHPGVCPSCRDRKTRSTNDVHRGRAARGLCIRCGKPAMTGRRLCAYHRDRDNARRRKQ